MCRSKGSDCPFLHTPDYREVSFSGQTWHFTALQAAAVEYLHGVRRQGFRYIGQAAVLEAIESTSPSLRRLFRLRGRRHAAWGVLIVCGPLRGTVGLDLRLSACLN